MRYEEKQSISKARIANAESCLHAAKCLYEIEEYKSAANRCYYTIFHAMRAVLAMDGIDMKHHAGVISEFRRLYIKTHCFDESLSTIISSLFDMRTDSDYDDFYVLSKTAVAAAVTDADFFLRSVKTYLKY